MTLLPLGPAACTAVIHPGSYYEPPSYCDDDTAPGSDYCPRHTEPDDDPDRHRDDPEDATP